MKFLLYVSLLVKLVCASSPGNLVEVRAPCGPLQGRVSQVGDGSSLTALEYLGIPYALPPVGERRFQVPEAVAPWREVRGALHLPSTCPQQDVSAMLGEAWAINTNVSEDCLYLNVWTPEPLPRTPRPVMVWIHGGGLSMGSSTSPYYDGKILSVYNDVVVVSMQYRLGILGLLAMGSSSTAPGNVLFLDQQLALKWVHDNIGAFGGDAGKVTLFGESAGAGSVNFHLYSKNSRLYFHRAIMQSGQLLQNMGALMSEEDGVAKTLKLATSLGCPANRDTPEVTLACLREQDESKLVPSLTGEELEYFLPLAYDPNFLQSSVEEIINTKSYYKAPVLLGANKDEGSIFVAVADRDNPVLNQTTFLSTLQTSLFLFSPNERQLEAAAYLYTDWDDPQDSDKLVASLVQAVGDCWFLCRMWSMAQLYAGDGTDTYTYLFSQRTDTSFLLGGEPQWAGVTHGMEMYFMFGIPWRTDVAGTQAEKEFSRDMMAYWANFAHTGNPNLNKPVPTHWSKRSPNSSEYLVLSADAGERRMALGPKNRECMFWTKLFPLLANTSTEGVEQAIGDGGPTLSVPVLMLITVAFLITIIRVHKLM